MAILAECPVCHKKQSIKNKRCACGTDLDREKRRKERVKYHVVHHINGKQKWQMVGYSIAEARDADGKRKVQKREHRIFEILPEADMSFRDLSEWFVEKVLPVRAQIRKLKDPETIKGRLAVFNKRFGNARVLDITDVDLRAYQAEKKAEDRSDATVDQHIKAARQVVREAFRNRLVSGDVLRVFENVDLLLSKGSNARKRTLTVDEYLRLIEAAPPHLKAMLIIAMNTGMRAGEIRLMKWRHVDWEKTFIRLPAELTKEKKPKNVPVNEDVRGLLEILRKHRTEEHDFVITYKGKPITQRNGVKKSLQTACQKAGVEYGTGVEGGFTLRDIRRTVKTNMVAAGIAKEYRDTILGHSLKGMDQHYIKPSEESLKKAMDTYTEWMDRQVQKVFIGVLEFLLFTLSAHGAAQMLDKPLDETKKEAAAFG
jgi:integrase